MNPRTTRIITAAAIVGLVAVTLFLAYEGLNSTTIARVVGYQRFGDDRGIVLVVEVGALTDLAERQVEETATTVKVTVHVHRPTGAVPSYAIVIPVSVSLHDGLRGRTVLDHDGRPVQDLGVYRRPQGTASP